MTWTSAWRWNRYLLDGDVKRAGIVTWYGGLLAAIYDVDGKALKETRFFPSRRDIDKAVEWCNSFFKVQR